VHILPAEFRPLEIGEDVCGFDSQPCRMISCSYGSHR
jgi:hypothetical protein